MKGDTSFPCRNHQTYVQETKDETMHKTRKGPTVPVRSGFSVRDRPELPVNQSLKGLTYKTSWKCKLTRKFINLACLYLYNIYLLDIQTNGNIFMAIYFLKKVVKCVKLCIIGICTKFLPFNVISFGV